MYSWHQKGICGITAAAAPGTSNHEGGRAVDISYYDYWYTALTNNGWTHSLPSSDPVHYDYLGVSDLAAVNLIAFQKLWNLNNPGSPISEDGIYGPMTANALYNSPCSGFALTTFPDEEETEAFLQ